MSPRFTRPIALMALFGIGFYVCGVPLALAAAGTVRGHVTLQGGGTLPPGSVVRATPRAGGAPLKGDIKADLTYEIPQVPQGAYVFEIVGPDGNVLGSLTTLVSPGVVTVNLTAKAAPVAVPTPTPRPTPKPVATPTPPPPPVPHHPVNKKWAVIGAIVGGLGIGAALGNHGGESNGSPSQP